MEVDIKKHISDWLITDTRLLRNKYIMMEKLIFIMLSDYLKQQEKTIHLHNQFDAIAPNGFDCFKGKTIVEIKYKTISIHFIRNIVDAAIRYENDLSNLIIIIACDIPQSYKTRILKSVCDLNFNLAIWYINYLIKIFENNKELFWQTYTNINEIYIKETINDGLNRNRSSQSEQKSNYLKELNNAYQKDDLVLFLGAGASSDAKIATWNTLISELFVALIDKKLNDKGIVLDKTSRKKLVKELMDQNNSSPLLQTRFLKQGIENEFESVVRDILYKNVQDTSSLLNEIGQLCIPKRGKFGIQAIINYNFDDLIETNLEKLRLNYRSVYTEGVIPENDEIGVYHVHGFLPRKSDAYENLTKSLLVFSEEGYHKLMLEPYNWANMIQLNYLTSNTCLFIGLSMTDPNLRRLLDIAAQKTIDEKCKHFAILKRFKIESEEENVRKFEQVNDELQESFYRDLGVNVIWVDEYSEIPKIISKIKDK